MAVDINKLNRSIASFMLLSLALTAPSAMADFPAVTDISSKVDFRPVAKYAAPMIPIIEQSSEIHHAISLYAVPSRPIGEIRPIEPQPVPVQPIISLYAVPPDFPHIKPTDPQILIPIKEETIIRRTDKINNLNKSLMNVGKNINKIQKPSVEDAPKFMKKTDVVKGSKDFDKINNIAKHPGKAFSEPHSRVKAGDFVYTNYGSYRTIEPASYSFFK